MVLKAAAIVTKKGEILLSKQYTEMTRSKIEGLLVLFTRLITKDKQHTFVETDEVRYVYQALNNLYCVLITDKQSNMLEDIETIRIFVGVINEYASPSGSKIGLSDEQAIINNRFILSDAFDEMVSLGYRGNVNLSSLRTIMEMDSHEERVYANMRQNQMREAKAKAREKAKEIRALKRSQELGHQMNQMSNSMSSASIGSADHRTMTSVVDIDEKPSKPTRPIRSGKALKLGPRGNQ